MGHLQNDGISTNSKLEFPKSGSYIHTNEGALDQGFITKILKKDENEKF
jgi:hypothetical protein